MLFLNTRPIDRAAALTHALRAAHIEVLELPLLHLLPTPWSVQLAGLYQQLPLTQVIVVVSPSAVHWGMQGLQQAGLCLNELTQVHWIAVGVATQKALLSYGIESSVPQVETSEGMLNLPVLQQLQSDARIAFWRGEGGRQFMMDRLLQRGMCILNFILYTRACPAVAKSQLNRYLPQLQQQSEYFILISSEASWLNWLSLCSQHLDLINKAHYLVLGQRLSDILTAYRARDTLRYRIYALDDLRTPSILQCIKHVQGQT